MNFKVSTYYLGYGNNVNIILSFLRLKHVFEMVGTKRTPGTQGGYQAAGIAVALVFGIVGGAIVGT